MIMKKKRHGTLILKRPTNRLIHCIGNSSRGMDDVEVLATFSMPYEALRSSRYLVQTGFSHNPRVTLILIQVRRDILP